jgi:hypothetical protein
MDSSLGLRNGWKVTHGELGDWWEMAEKFCWGE